MNILLGALSAIIGLLVIMFKIQGGRLHAAQLTILSAKLKTMNDEDGAKVEKALEEFSQAYGDYHRARTKNGL
jgi:hypothetical protein